MSVSLRIALLGAGQLGGSFALAVKSEPEAAHITAYDPNMAHPEMLHARGAVDVVANSPADAVKNADIVVFAAPLRSYRGLAEAIKPALSKHTILTDLGSVKGTMVNLQLLLPEQRIVPGHPIAGSEKSGPDAVNGALFQNRLVILTPENGEPQSIRIVETLWQIAGADVLHMPWQVHDQIYAYVSHLPHYIAFIAASYFHHKGIKVLPEDEVLQQFLRISRSNPRMWTDVALENREALLPALATYIAILEHFVNELRAGEKIDHPDALSVTKKFLPRILASSLISSVSLYETQADMDLRPFGAGGMRDIVAPAAITPEEDMEAISHQAHAMADAIEGIIPEFLKLESLIGAEDADGLYRYISTLVDDAHALAANRN